MGRCQRTAPKALCALTSGTRNTTSRRTDRNAERVLARAVSHSVGTLISGPGALAGHHAPTCQFGPGGGSLARALTWCQYDEQLTVLPTLTHVVSLGRTSESPCPASRVPRRYSASHVASP